MLMVGVPDIHYNFRKEYKDKYADEMNYRRNNNLFHVYLFLKVTNARHNKLHKIITKIIKLVCVVC